MYLIFKVKIWVHSFSVFVYTYPALVSPAGSDCGPAALWAGDPGQSASHWVGVTPLERLWAPAAVYAVPHPNHETHGSVPAAHTTPGPETGPETQFCREWERRLHLTNR